MKGNKRKFAFISFYLLFGIGTFQRVTTKKSKKNCSTLETRSGCKKRRTAPILTLVGAHFRALHDRDCHCKDHSADFGFTQENIGKFLNSLRTRIAVSVQPVTLIRVNFRPNSREFERVLNAATRECLPLEARPPAVRTPVPARAPWPLSGPTCRSLR